MKNFCIILVLCMLFLDGCQIKDNPSDSLTNIETNEMLESSSVDFLSELGNEQESESETVVEELYPHVGSRTAHLMNIYDMNETIIMGRQILYDGKEISVQVKYRIEVQDEKIEDMTRIVFLLNDGIPQPFYWEDATEETMFATVDLSKDDNGIEKTYHVRFTPSYVPYGSETCMTLVMLTQYEYYFDNPNTTMTSGGGGLKFSLTASSEEYAISREESIPVIDAQSDYEWKKGEDSQVRGIVVTNKVTSGEQLRINTAFTTEEPLYATFLPTGNMEQDTEMQIFAFMDGEPLYAFDGSWYCFTYVNSGQLYEIPLDMSQIPSGEHLIYFLGYETAKEGYIAQKYDIHGSGSTAVIVYIYDITIP